MIGLEGLVVHEVDVHDLLGVRAVVVLDHATRIFHGIAPLLGREVGLLDSEAGVSEAVGHPQLAEAAAEDARLVAVHGGHVAGSLDLPADVAELLGGLDAAAVGDAVHAAEHLGASLGLVVGAAAINALEDALGVHVNDFDGAVVFSDDGCIPAAGLEDADDVLGSERLVLSLGGG